jgi:hypothetical protein
MILLTSRHLNAVQHASTSNNGACIKCGAHVESRRVLYVDTLLQAHHTLLLLRLPLPLQISHRFHSSKRLIETATTSQCHQACSTARNLPPIRIGIRHDPFAEVPSGSTVETVYTLPFHAIRYALQASRHRQQIPTKTSTTTAEPAEAVK